MAYHIREMENCLISRSKAGAVMIELVITLPIFIFFVLTAYDLGFMLDDRSKVDRYVLYATEVLNQVSNDEDPNVTEMEEAAKHLLEVAVGLYGKDKDDFEYLHQVFRYEPSTGYYMPFIAIGIKEKSSRSILGLSGLYKPCVKAFHPVNLIESEFVWDDITYPTDMSSLTFESFC